MKAKFLLIAALCAMGITVSACTPSENTDATDTTATSMDTTAPVAAPAATTIDTTAPAVIDTLAPADTAADTTGM